MLTAEYDYATDIAVQREEARKIAFDEGIEQGIERGFAEGSYQTKLETAQLMKAMSYPLEDICKITELSRAEIEKL